MGVRSERLAADLKVESLAGAPRALAEEAVKVLERLERLDAILAGDESAWLGIRQRLDSDVVEVTINAPLAEARQQGMAMRALLAEFAKMTGTKVEAPPASKADELGAKRAARRQKQTGSV